jgi:hypothetical protein
MATIRRFHDLSPFTLPPGEGVPGMSLVQYHDKSQSLIATDGRVAIFAPVSGNGCPTTLIPPDRLKAACAEAGKDGVEITASAKGITLAGKRLPASDGRFPPVFKVLPKRTPDLLVSINPAVLEAICAHARRNKASSIQFGFRHGKRGKHGLELVDGGPEDCGIDFFYDVPEGDDSATIRGILMPMQIGDDADGQEMASRAATVFQALADAGDKQPDLSAARATTAKATTAKATTAKTSGTRPPQAATKPAAKVEPGPVKEPKPAKARQPKPVDPVKLSRAMQRAAYKGDLAAVRQAITAGADVTFADPQGYTALMSAAGKGHADIVQLLLDAGADPNAKSKRLVTPMHCAAAIGSLPSVKALLAAGAKAHPKDDQGYVPLDDAEENGHKSIVRLLKASKK